MTFDGRQPVAAVPSIAVISSGRPGRVADMHGHLGARLTPAALWIVGEGESEDYRYAGAKNILEGGGLIASRNLALEIAFQQNRISVQLSDDITGVDWSFDRKNKYRITLERAIAMVMAPLQHDGPMLAGAGATDNLFYMPKDDVSKHVFIIGDLMAVKPCDLRFDPNLHLKEDLDFSIQHLKKYGEVARMNTILANWQHRTNHGGAVQYRTAAGEQEAVDYIAAKHPGWVRLNPNREIPELLLQWPPKEPE